MAVQRKAAPCSNDQSEGRGRTCWLETIRQVEYPPNLVTCTHDRVRSYGRMALLGNGSPP